MPEHFKPEMYRMPPDSLDDIPTQLVGHDNSPRTHFIPFRLELRLDEGEDFDRRKLTERRQYESQRNKRDIDRYQINRFPDPGRVDVSDVDLVLDLHPRIFPELPVQLSLAHIQGMHPACAVVKQAIGEAAG